MSIGGKKFFIQNEKDLELDLFISSPFSTIPKKNKVEKVIIDTGSDYTLMPTKHTKGLNLLYNGKKTISGVFSDEKEVDFYMANIEINSVVDDIFEIGVSDDFTPVIGMNLIIKWNTLINGPEGTFEIAAPK